MHKYIAEITPRHPRPLDEGIKFDVRFSSESRRRAKTLIDRYFQPEFFVTRFNRFAPLVKLRANR